MAKKTPLQEALDEAQFFAGKSFHLGDGTKISVGDEVPQARYFPNLASWVRSGHIIIKGAVTVADLAPYLADKEKDEETRMFVRKNRVLEEAGEQDPYLLRNARRAKSAVEQDLPAKRPRSKKKKKTTRKAAKKTTKKKKARKAAKRTRK